MWRAAKSWTASNVTYNSYNPASGGETNLTDIHTLSGNNRYYWWAVSASDIQNERTGANRNGWLMKDDGDYNISNIFTFFHSRDNANKPTLRIRFY